MALNFSRAAETPQGTFRAPAVSKYRLFYGHSWESFVLRLTKVIIGALLLIVSIGPVQADTTNTKPVRLLPARLGSFRQASTYNGSSSVKPGLFGSNFEAAEQAEFVGNNGNRLVVEIVRFTQEAYAYEFLSLMANRLRQAGTPLEIRPGYGTAGFVSDSESAFFKGAHFIRLSSTKPVDSTTRDALIAELSANLEKGEAEVPVLINHLPNPEDAQKTAVFLHSFSDLELLGIQSGVFSAVQAERNADAVAASYGPSKVVIIEFNTPQLASDNDRRIIARIQDLWKLGQPAPTAYRRVGNYSVFVFDAPDEPTAQQLIDQVKYEQVVQWLGENPNILKEAQKRYVNTTLGVLVAVLKASGYALVLCLGMGGLLGGLLFTYRRAQHEGVTAFSDAGGMLRLNLDELTPETDPARLLREKN